MQDPDEELKTTDKSAIYPTVEDDKTPSYRREVNFKGQGNDGDSITQTGITMIAIVAVSILVIFLVLKFLL